MNSDCRCAHMRITMLHVTPKQAIDFVRLQTPIDLHVRFPLLWCHSCSIFTFGLLILACVFRCQVLTYRVHGGSCRYKLLNGIRVDCDYLSITAIAGEHGYEWSPREELLGAITREDRFEATAAVGVSSCSVGICTLGSTFGSTGHW